MAFDEETVSLRDFFQSLEPTKAYLVKKKKREIRQETIDLLKTVVLREKWNKIVKKVLIILKNQQNKWKAVERENFPCKIESNFDKPSKTQHSWKKNKFSIKKKIFNFKKLKKSHFESKFLHSRIRSTTTENFAGSQTKQCCKSSKNYNLERYFAKEFRSTLYLASSLFSKYSRLTDVSSWMLQKPNATTYCYLSNEWQSHEMPTSSSLPKDSLGYSTSKNNEEDSTSQSENNKSTKLILLNHVTDQSEFKLKVLQRFLELYTNVDDQMIIDLADDFAQEFIFWCEALIIPKPYLFYFANGFFEDLNKLLMKRKITRNFDWHKSYLNNKIKVTPATEKKKLKWKCLGIQKNESNEFSKFLIMDNVRSWFGDIEKNFEETRNLCEGSLLTLIGVSKNHLEYFLNALSKYDREGTLEESLKSKLIEIWTRFLMWFTEDYTYEENLAFNLKVYEALQLCPPESKNQDFLEYLKAHSKCDKLPEQRNAFNPGVCSSSMHNDLGLNLDEHHQPEAELNDAELFEIFASPTCILADELLKNGIFRFQNIVSTKIFTFNRGRLFKLLEESVQAYVNKLEELDLSQQVSQSFKLKMTRKCIHYLKTHFKASTEIEQIQVEALFEPKARPSHLVQEKGSAGSPCEVMQTEDLHGYETALQKWVNPDDNNEGTENSKQPKYGIPLQHSGHWKQASLARCRNFFRMVDKAVKATPTKSMTTDRQTRKKSYSSKSTGSDVGAMFYVQKK